MVVSPAWAAGSAGWQERRGGPDELLGVCHEDDQGAGAGGSLGDKDRLFARVDLRARTCRGAVLVQPSHAEPEAPDGSPEALAGELRGPAGWLALDDVALVGPGDLAPALACAVWRR